MTKVRKVTPDERVESDPTMGLVREEAIASDRMWTGIARAQPGSVSGWHHHGDHETAVYVLAGIFRVEYGSEAVEGHPGDFVLVPKNLVHREANPSDEESRLVIFRTGTGPPTINVEGPDSSS